MRLFSIWMLLLLPVLSVPALSHALEKKSGWNDLDFSVALYRAAAPEKGSLFFSPYSIGNAFGLVYAGARNQTAQEIETVFHFPGQATHAQLQASAKTLAALPNQDKIRLEIQNSLWVQQDFTLSDAYLKLTQQYYQAQPFSLDFKDTAAACRQINTWVKDRTQSRILDLLAPDDVQNAMLVLVNTLYFKGAWEQAFDPKQTRPESFFGPEKENPLPMMHLEKIFRYGEDDDVQILEMPYQGNKLSLLIFLPKAREGLARLESQWTAQQVRHWLRGLYDNRIALSLPKFKLNIRYQLSEKLQALGLKTAFNPDRADFSGLSSGRLCLSKVIHQACLEISEEGTEAAAATAVVMLRATSVMPGAGAQPFRANHPFIFMLRENETGTILFMGRFEGD